MGAVITNKDGFGWDNDTNFIDFHGRYFGSAPRNLEQTGGVEYDTANTKTIYVQNHTFAPVKIDKTLAINIMPTSNVWYYNGSAPYIGIATITVVYTLIGILGHPTSSTTVTFKKSMTNGDSICQVDGVVMEAGLNISGYAIGDVNLTITSVKLELDSGNLVYALGAGATNASMYIAYYPMSEAGV